MGEINWFSGLNKHNIDSYLNYVKMYKVAVITAFKTNPNIKPFLIFDGVEDEHIVELKKLGVEIIAHRCSFYNELKEHYGNDTIALGAFLRIDIPIICERLKINSDCVLYTDNDVIFMGDISDLLNKTPNYFLVAGEFFKTYIPQNMNTGVMWINWKNMLKCYDKFVDFIKGNFNNFNVYDQDALKMFFLTNAEELEYKYNYKPYWGEEENIKILHFHGPKPEHVLMKEVYPFPNLYHPFYYEMVEYFNKINDEYENTRNNK